MILSALAQTVVLCRRFARHHIVRSLGGLINDCLDLIVAVTPECGEVCETEAGNMEFRGRTDQTMVEVHACQIART